MWIPPAARPNFASPIAASRKTSIPPFSGFYAVVPDFFLESRINWASFVRQMNFPSNQFSPPGSVFTESPLRDLEAVIRSRTPLIVMESSEESQIVGLARQIAHRQQLKAFRWTVTDGLQALDPADQPLQTVEK